MKLVCLDFVTFLKRKSNTLMYSIIRHMHMCAKVVFPLSVIGFIKYIKVNSSNQIENFARVNV